MSKGWTKLAKDQQRSGEDSSDHELLLRKRDNSVSTTTQVADQQLQLIKASKLLQVLQKWKAHPTPKRRTAMVNTSSRRSHRSVARSLSCGLPVISCMAVSGIDIHSDNDHVSDDDHVYDDDGHGAGGGGGGGGGGELYIEEAETEVLHQRAPLRRKFSVEHGAPRRTKSWPMCGTLSIPPWSCTSNVFVCSDCDDEQEGGLVQTLDQRQDVRVRHRSAPPLSSKSITSKRRPPSTPKGYLAVYVGEERRRFLVKATMLNHPLFGILLEKAREEFGFNQEGPLSIPCDIEFFQHIMLLVESNDSALRNADYSTILLQFDSSKLCS